MPVIKHHFASIANPGPQARQVAISLAHLVDGINDIPAHEAEYSCIQGDWVVGECPHHAIEKREELGENFAALLPALSYRDDNISALAPRIDEPRKHIRRVLKISIHKDYTSAARSLQPSRDCAHVAPIA